MKKGCEDRVGWNREQVLCFHPADPAVEIDSNERILADLDYFLAMAMIAYSLIVDNNSNEMIYLCVYLLTCAGITEQPGEGGRCVPHHRDSTRCQGDI